MPKSNIFKFSFLVGKEVRRNEINLNPDSQKPKASRRQTNQTIVVGKTIEIKLFFEEI